MEYLYEIQLDVPLGIRKGNMTIHIMEEHVSGELDVLGNKEVFEGNITKNGEICINGTLVSLVRRMPYKGIGNIQENEIQMVLSVGNDSYKLTGHLINNERGSERE